MFQSAFLPAAVRELGYLDVFEEIALPKSKPF
jgi:hypothetical protein